MPEVPTGKKTFSYIEKIRPTEPPPEEKQTFDYLDKLRPVPDDDGAEEKHNLAQDLNPPHEANIFEMSENSELTVNALRDASPEELNSKAYPKELMDRNPALRGFVGDSANSAAVAKNSYDSMANIEEAARGLDALKKFRTETLENIDTVPTTTVGGLAKAIPVGLASGVAEVGKGLNNLFDFFAPVLIDKRRLAFRDKNLEKITLSKDLQEWLRSQYGDTKAEQIVAQGFESLGTMGALYLTGGTSSILPGMSTIAGVNKGAEVLEAGEQGEAAFVAGVTQAAIEYLTEKIPLDILLGQGKSFIGKLVKGAAFDIPGEVAATALEMYVIDQKIRGGEAKSEDEYKQALIDTVYVAFITTFAATSTTHSVQKTKQALVELEETLTLPTLPGAVFRPTVGVSRIDISSKTSEGFRDTVAQIREHVVESEIQQLSPAKMENFLAQAGLGEEVYISKEFAEDEFLFQTDPDKKEQTKKALQDIGVDVEAMEEEARQGQDSKIRLDKVLARLEDTELFARVSKHLKPDANAYSANQLENLINSEDVQRLGENYTETLKEDAPFQEELIRVQGEIVKAGFGEQYAQDVGNIVERFSNRMALWGQDRLEFLKKISVEAVKFEDDRGIVTKAIDKITGREVPKVPKGALNIDSAEHVISLFESKNMSTVLHEVGHVFLKEMNYLAELGTDSTAFNKDYKVITEWLGVEPGQEVSVAQQEQFAKGFERYLLEGKTPTIELEGVFSRFRKWLVQLYGDAKGTKVEITPAVRSVFDRLLNTEIDVDTTADIQGIGFRTTEELNALGVSTETQTYLKGLNRQAINSAKFQKDKARLESEKKNMSTWQKEAEAKVLAKDTRGIYRIVDDLVKGEGDVKGLNKAEFVARYKQKGVQKLPNQRMLKANGFPLARSAFQLGFVNVDDMVNTFFATTPQYKAVAAEVEQLRRQNALRFRAEDFLAGRPEYEAYNATLHKVLAKQLAQDLVVTDIAGKTKKSKKLISRQAIKAYAQKVLSEKLVKDARSPNRYVTATRLASQEARKAEKAGKHFEAIQLNERVRFNDEMAKQSIAFRDELRVFLDKAKKLQKPILKGKVSPIQVEYREAINQLTQQFDLVSRPARVVAEFKSISHLFEGNADEHTYGFDAPDFILSAKSIKYPDLSVTELRDLRDAINYLEGVGRSLVKQVLADGKTAVVDVVFASNMESASLKTVKVHRKDSKMEAATNFSRSVFSATDTIQPMMIAKGGYQNIHPILKESITEKQTTNRLIEAQNAEIHLYRDKGATLEGILRYMQIQVRDWGRKFGKETIVDVNKVPIPERRKKIGYYTWTGNEVFAIALNGGTQSNIDKLVGGYGEDFTNAHRLQILDTLSTKDMDKVQEVWDLFETLHPLLDAVHVRMRNYHMSKVEATPFTFKGKEYRGGYYPVVYDGAMDRKIAAFNEKDDLLSREEAIWQVPVTKSSFERKRTGITSLPVKLSVDVASVHLKDSLHRVTHAEVVRDVDRIFRNDDFADEFVRAFGQQAYERLRPSLAFIARPNPGELEVWGNKVIEWLTKKATLATLTWNLSVGAKQVFSTPSAILEMGVDNYVKGMKAVMQDPAIHIQDMFELSDYMFDRKKAIYRDIHSVVAGLKKNQKGVWFGDELITWDEVRNFGFWPIHVMDQLTVMPIWWGSYYKKMDDTGGDQAEAVKFADDRVRRTQPSAQPLDLSHWQRAGGAWRLFSRYQTFTISKYGQRQRLHYRAWRNNKMTTPQYAWFNFMEAILPALGMQTLMAILWGQDLEDKDTWIGAARDAALQMFLMGVPLMSQLFSGYQDSFDSPLFKGPNIVKKAITREIKGVSNNINEQRMWDMAEFASYLLGVPIATVLNKAFRGTKQEQENIPGVKHLIPAPKRKQK